MPTERELPRYKCHKEVYALKIKEVIDMLPVPHAVDGGATIVPENENYDAFIVDEAYMKRHEPQAGGYYVVYESGYTSFSPAGAFESGYTLIDP